MPRTQYRRVIGANARARAREGDWEETYFKALERGHTKESAAGIAGVSAQTPYKRVQRGDTEFAERQEVSYNRGTAMLMEVARRRILDPKRPGDQVLKHLLSVRGVSERVQVTGADDGPVITRIERVIVYPENRNDDADADPKADAAAGPEAQDDAA